MNKKTNNFSGISNGHTIATIAKLNHVKNYCAYFSLFTRPLTKSERMKLIDFANLLMYLNFKKIIRTLM